MIEVMEVMDDGPNFSRRHVIFSPGIRGRFWWVSEVPIASVRSCELGCVCAAEVVRQPLGWIGTATGPKWSERNVGDNGSAIDSQIFVGGFLPDN